jgi:hypothetical protein
MSCTKHLMVQPDHSTLPGAPLPGANASPVFNCALLSTAGSEFERALKAKEGKRWDHGCCRDGKGCPSVIGT